MKVVPIFLLLAQSLCVQVRFPTFPACKQNDLTFISFQNDAYPGFYGRVYYRKQTVRYLLNSRNSIKLHYKAEGFSSWRSTSPTRVKAVNETFSFFYFDFVPLVEAPEQYKLSLFATVNGINGYDCSENMHEFHVNNQDPTDLEYDTGYPYFHYVSVRFVPESYQKLLVADSVFSVNALEKYKKIGIWYSADTCEGGGNETRLTLKYSLNEQNALKTASVPIEAGTSGTYLFDWYVIEPTSHWDQVEFSAILEECGRKSYVNDNSGIGYSFSS